MEKVTAWFKHNKDKIIFNHIEDGWCETDTPTVKRHGTSQDLWHTAKWNKEFGYLDEKHVYTKIDSEL